MKISEKQRKAASLYWAKKLLTSTDLLGNKASPQNVRVFRDTLNRLLIDADVNLTLLSFNSKGSPWNHLVRQALFIAEIPEYFLPFDNLSMTFDNNDNLFVGSERINADEILKDEEIFINETIENNSNQTAVANRSSIQVVASPKLSVGSGVSVTAQTEVSKQKIVVNPNALEPSEIQRQAPIEKSFSVIFKRADEAKQHLSSHVGVSSGVNDHKKPSSTRLPRINYTFPMRKGFESQYAKIDEMKFHQDDQIAGEYSYFLNEMYKGYDAKQYIDKISGKWVIKFPKGSEDVNRVSHQLIAALKQNKFFNFKVSKPSDEFNEQLIKDVRMRLAFSKLQNYQPNLGLMFYTVILCRITYIRLML